MCITRLIDLTERVGKQLELGLGNTWGGCILIDVRSHEQFHPGNHRSSGEEPSSGSEAVVVEKEVPSEDTLEKRVDKLNDAVNLLEDEALSEVVSPRFGAGGLANDYKAVVQKVSLDLARWVVVPLILSFAMQILWNTKSGSRLRNGDMDASNFSGLRRMEEMESSIKASIQELRNDVEAIRDATESMQEEVAGWSSRFGSMADEDGSVRDVLKRLELEIFAISRSPLVLEGHSCNSALAVDLPAQHSNNEVLHMTREMVQEEIEKHAADGIGMADYALASGGATVLRHSEPLYPTYGANNFTVHHDAAKMLQPSFGEPGQCFPLKGQSGFIDIHLTAEIIPESMTLEHIDDRSLMKHYLHRKTASKIAVSMVRFEFLSNYGANHTCIYRFRIHGHVPDIALESSTSTSGVSVHRVGTVILHLLVAISVSMARRIIV
ncbi:hypothetical protein MLD38_038436 [Melastoma candidum]|uniref:Uncharacterized protein n=1 Tax=Melastoma candidum TaxID=119954 RepID=A0ACB9KYV9_9MYRT|nr:hypothetical protein MLD38_038436 [Melastoma candidum]